MKCYRRDLATALLLVVLLPGLLCNTVRMMLGNETGTVEPQPVITEPAGAPAAAIRLLTDEGVVTMELEDYIVGVVLAEMPEDFETEALKAQAVVARTYVLRMRQHSGKHPDADVCDRSDCCQGYRSGESGKIRAAVEATAGQVLTYEGMLIEATYFSSSGGRTEDALAVWGNDVPYLQSTDSPEGAYQQQYLETVSMTAEEFQKALGLSLDGPCETWLGEVTYTTGGGIGTMMIGGQLFEGTELRKLLGLRSTAMVMTAVGEHITITTRGHGHRVGMSQYGAEAMAMAGATYDEILAHYYHGTTLELFVDKDSAVG